MIVSGNLSSLAWAGARAGRFLLASAGPNPLGSVLFFDL